METSLMFVGPSESPLVLLSWRKLSWNKRKAFGDVFSFPALQQETAQYSASCLPWASVPSFPLTLWGDRVNAAAKRGSFLQSSHCGAAHGLLKLFVSEEWKNGGQKSSGSTLNPENFWNSLHARFIYLRAPALPYSSQTNMTRTGFQTNSGDNCLEEAAFPHTSASLLLFLWQKQRVDGFAWFLSHKHYRTVTKDKGLHHFNQ